MILVMEHGRITGRGTHAELMLESDRYRHMVELQQLEPGDAPAPTSPLPTGR